MFHLDFYSDFQGKWPVAPVKYRLFAINIEAINWFQSKTL